MRDPSSGPPGRSDEPLPGAQSINDGNTSDNNSLNSLSSPNTHLKIVKLSAKTQHQCQLVNNCSSFKMPLNRLVTLALLVLCSILVDSAGAVEKRVVCYYTNWSAYRQGPAKFLPDNINPYLCTHLVYAFGGLTSDSGIKPFDKYQDIDKGGYTKFNGLKTYNKALKTLIAIGGWNEGSRRFSNLVANSESRKTFIKHAIRFLRQHHFDGLDLDWEYPASREGGVPEDKKNYALYIKELREAFEEESKATGRTRLLLTIAVPAGIEWITKGFDIPVINRNVDFFNLLTYDYHASTEPNANHHAPLKARNGLSEYDWKGQLNIEYTIEHYLKEGADADKLVVGLPTYGRSYTLFNTESHDIDAPASGPGTKGRFTKEPGYLAYYEVCEGVKSGEWRVENGQSDAQGPHAVNGDQWVGYDDPRIMGVKGKWVKDNGLGGIMFWSVDNDDFRGTCHGKPFPLIEAAKSAYYTGDAPGQSPQRPSSTSLSNRFSKPSTAPSSSTNARNRFSSLALANRRFSTPAPPSTTTGSSKKSKGRRRNKNKKRNKKRNNRNKARTEATTTTTTSTTTTTPAPTFSPFNTPAPPTTPDPGVDFECKEDGFFPHPRECKKYFWCLDAPGLGLVAHHFTCPAGLYFNRNTDSCDYARNVPCKPGGSTTTTKASTTTTTTTTTPKPTTTRTTTTTTTTPPPPEEEEDDEYYDDEEGGEDTDEEEEDAEEADEGGRSVKEINDIRDLLKLIKKLGGVEELEKFFEENPSIAAAAAEFDKDEKVKPKSKYTPSTSLNTRNRFTPPSSSSTSSGNRSRFSSSTNLKYTTIQRNRNPQKPVDMTEEETDGVDDKPSTRSSTTQTSSTPFRQKYVQLSRGRSTSTATESSRGNAKAVQAEEKKAIETGNESEEISDEAQDTNGESEEEEGDDDEGSIVEETGAPSETTPFVSTSVSVSTSATATDGETQTTQTDETTTSKPRLRIPTRKPGTLTTSSRSRASSLSTSGTSSRATSTFQTTLVTAADTTNPAEEEITTTSTRKARNFTVGNRRNLFSTRARSNTTPVPEAVNSAKDESNPTGNEVVTRATDPFQRAFRSRVRSRSSADRSIDTNSVAPSNNDVSLSRSRSRYRSTTSTSTDNSISPETSKPTIATPILFRRRSRPTTTVRPTTTTTRATTTTTTTTQRPTTVIVTENKNKKDENKSDEDESDYYYYYYDEDEEEGATEKNNLGPDDLLDKSQTQRTTGLRTQDFASLTASSGGGEKGFTKRNLHTRHGSNVNSTTSIVNLKGNNDVQSVSPKTTGKTEEVSYRRRSSSGGNSNNNNNYRRSYDSFTSGSSRRTQQTLQQQVVSPSPFDKIISGGKSEVSGTDDPKWSPRAVVPLSEKIRLRPDGSVQCLDKGLYPHPVSCRQFVHCAASDTNDGNIKSWVYACPKSLSFDAVGGMCNWTNDNACIE